MAGTTADKLQGIINAKSGIAAAIAAKGGTVPSLFEDYGDAITALPSGTYGGPTLKNMLDTSSGASGFTVTTADLSGTTIIRQHAFEGLVGLLDIDLSTVTKIDNFAFNNCSSLASVDLSALTNNVGFNAFANCTSLTSVELPGDIVPGMLSFDGCTGLVSVTIGKGTRFSAGTGVGAFKGCTSLTSVDFRAPSVITTVSGGTITGQGCFEGCTALREITLPDSITTINARAFYGCTSLVKIDFGSTRATVPTLNDVNAFTNLPANYKIVVPDDLVTTWKGTNNWSNSAVVNHIIGQSDYSLTRVIFTDGTDGFYSWFGEIDRQTMIDEDLWSGSSWTEDIRQIDLANSVTSIGDNVFHNCFTLTSMTIPDSVTDIGASAFSNCSGLWSITFGSGLLTIGTGWSCFVFYGCSNCRLYDFRSATQVPTLGNVNAFENTHGNKKIVVPDALYSTWVAANNWSSHTNGIVDAITRASDYNP